MTKAISHKFKQINYWNERKEYEWKEYFWLHLHINEFEFGSKNLSSIKICVASAIAALVHHFLSKVKIHENLQIATVRVQRHWIHCSSVEWVTVVCVQEIRYHRKRKSDRHDQYCWEAQPNPEPMMESLVPNWWTKTAAMHLKSVLDRADPPWTTRTAPPPRAWQFDIAIVSAILEILTLSNIALLASPLVHDMLELFSGGCRRWPWPTHPPLASWFLWQL